MQAKFIEVFSSDITEDNNELGSTHPNKSTCLTKSMNKQQVFGVNLFHNFQY